MKKISKRKFALRIFLLLLTIIVLKIIVSILIDTTSIMKLKIEENQKSKKLLELENKEKTLEDRINNLYDNSNIEKIAREKLNMKNSGEECYKLIDKNKEGKVEKKRLEIKN